MVANTDCQDVIYAKMTCNILGHWAKSDTLRYVTQSDGPTYKVIPYLHSRPIISRLLIHILPVWRHAYWTMSEPKPIPVAEKPSEPQPKASSLPRGKKPVSRTSSSPQFVENASSFVAELRRRSDSLFHSNEQLAKDETDSYRRSNVSTLSSEEEDRSRSNSAASPDQHRIDAWLDWRKNRRNSSPNVKYNYGSSVGTPV